VATAEKYLLFVWKPTGYELRERDGQLPSVGSVVELEEGRMQVNRLAASPLPGDDRRCAYLQPVAGERPLFAESLATFSHYRPARVGVGFADARPKCMSSFLLERPQRRNRQSRFRGGASSARTRPR
jgi:hypothetical protein